MQVRKGQPNEAEETRQQAGASGTKRKCMPENMEASFWSSVTKKSQPQFPLSKVNEQNWSSPSIPNEIKKPSPD